LLAGDEKTEQLFKKKQKLTKPDTFFSCDKKKQIKPQQNSVVEFCPFVVL